MKQHDFYVELLQWLLKCEINHCQRHKRPDDCNHLASPKVDLPRQCPLGCAIRNLQARPDPIEKVSAAVGSAQSNER